MTIAEFARHFGRYHDEARQDPRKRVEPSAARQVDDRAERHATFQLD